MRSLRSTFLIDDLILGGKCWELALVGHAVRKRPFTAHSFMLRGTSEDIRCRFAKHNKTLIIGACCSNIGDRCIRLTVHHCFFDGTTQRHPRVRFAKVHLYNNYTRNWGIYAVCASVESQIVSQCNIYEAGKKKKVFKYLPETAADKQECDSGWIRSEGDLFLNDAQPCLLEYGCGCSFEAHKHYQAWTMEPASANLKEALLVCTGWQPVPRPPDNNGCH